MMKPKWNPIKIKLGDIKAYDENPRMSTKAQAERIIASEKKFNQVIPFIVAPFENGKALLYDGHQRLSAWQTIHGADYEMDAMQSDRPLTDEEHKELIVTLHTGATGSWDWNRLSGWDAPKLQEWGMDKDTLKEWNNDTNNLKELLNSQEVETVDAEPQIERADELQEKWQVKEGDLWQLGDHKLLCGDCTNREDVSRLMGDEKATLLFTDPPYGVSIGDKNKFLNNFQKSGLVLTSIESDDDTAEDLGDMLLQAFILSKDFLAEDCSIFVCSPQGGSLGMMMMMMMRDAGMEVRHVLNWVKNSPTFSLGRLDYDYKHEPILFTWIKKHKKVMGGQFKNSVWTVDKPRANKEHPTMKPVELYENALLNHTDKGDILYEPFGGSGTGVIASQNTDRVCRMIELTPRYCAVILERFYTATGITPELLL